MSVSAENFLKTKIVCTIGPSSSDTATLRALCQAGMNVARLNMAHGTPAQTREAAQRVRQCADELDRPVALLADLQGPKIRIGPLDGPVDLKPRDRVIVAPIDKARAGELPITYADLSADLSLGDRVLIDDGRIELQVTGLKKSRIETEVVVGGRVTTGRGINLPGIHLSAPALTERDLEDLELALELSVDCLALSLVRRADDVRELRRRVPDDVLIMSKIEKAVAVADLDAILDASDAVMVARGDLGTELPFERVPLVQKRIVRRANAHYRPAVIATEMLETMTTRPRPTRAEVSDVANAILDGTDAVMLAAETATGSYPVESVQALTRVIREIESSSPVLETGPPYDVAGSKEDGASAPTEAAVAVATLEAVRALRAPAILSFTKSGYTARVVSSVRPPVPILTVTDTERVYRQLSMVWGVVPVLCREEPNYDNMWEAGRAELLRGGFASSGDRVVITAGVPFHKRGTTNMVRIEAL